VYRVSRRLVGPSAADDAFQAVFLVLACRAQSVRKAASVGSWLIGVAGRVGRQMRKRDLRASGGGGRPHQAKQTGGGGAPPLICKEIGGLPPPARPRSPN
jgi:DNA-directed RNA polymerase specialized sigma24 family protein